MQLVAATIDANQLNAVLSRSGFLIYSRYRYIIKIKTYFLEVNLLLSRLKLLDSRQRLHVRLSRVQTESHLVPNLSEMFNYNIKFVFTLSYSKIYAPICMYIYIHEAALC